jgi:DNA-binding transcriptional regulator YiaG
MTMTADEIRLALMRLDMTQGALAALVGVDPRTVRAWIAGARPMPLAAAIVLRLLARGRIGVADIEAARRD